MKSILHSLNIINIMKSPAFVFNTDEQRPKQGVGI